MIKPSCREIRSARLIGAALLLFAAACSPVISSPGNPAGTISANSSPSLESRTPRISTGWASRDADTPIPLSSPPTQTTAEPTLSPLPLLSETITPPASSANLTPDEEQAAPCLEDLCSYPSLLFLQRPIVPPGNDAVDPTYRFGSTQSGRRDPHHGVEFLNGYGTPVVAAAPGVVVVAGADIDPITPHGTWPILFYGPYSNFYGNLVVIEHTLPAGVAIAFPETAEPLFTLYGHLSHISVNIGQHVELGQQIGQVGMAGVATGSHLHFEVRLGENSYEAARNPELWLRPHAGADGQQNGAVAGRFLDIFGNPLEMDSIVLQRLPDGPDGVSDFEISTLTYEEKGLMGQLPFSESFGLGDLPPGLYRVSFPMNGLRRELLRIYPGQLTIATFKAQ